MASEMNPGPEIAKLEAFSRGALRVFGLRPGGNGSRIDPFLGVDHFRANGPTFPPHPHAGFSALTYLFRDSTTSSFNRDSLGNRNLIEPGALHWTAAARGVVHEEGPNEAGKEIHGLQIFVNLPQTRQTDPPFSLHLKAHEVPVYDAVEGVRVYVPFGPFEGINSGLEIPTDVTLLDVSLTSGSQFSLPIPADRTLFILPIVGSVSVDGSEYSIANAQAPVFLAAATERTLLLQAHKGNCQVAVFSGVPLNQPVYWAGGIAMASPETLERTVLSYKRGEFGAV